ncbi:unnamed protein product [Enterobius vermicularis]|uniref:Heme O synthase n=1 Tax=Enterobius vermicularis TaxID=51028 RepID=A0A0N4UUX9_ENTVE|nr:unnamed protein product [Enterobius vermicularis]
MKWVPLIIWRRNLMKEQLARAVFKEKLFATPYYARIPLEDRETETVEGWSIMKPRRFFNSYLKLSKSNLTALISLTAAGGYLMSPSMVSWSIIPCVAGTALLSSSANSINQFLESPYDAQMKRTASRLLVTHRFTPLRACTFALLSGILGTLILWTGCNASTTFLGLLNLFLYVGVYTPLKRHHIFCTWAGAVVGAIPPLMGYAAAGNLALPGFVIGALVYFWQFPHFNGLSWALRGEYTRAGYRVMCVLDERLCKASSLRNTIALIPLCSLAAPLSGLTSWTFALDSLPLNLYFAYLALRFYRNADSKSSHSLFMYSLLYLPLVFVVMFMSRLEVNKLSDPFIRP